MGTALAKDSLSPPETGKNIQGDAVASEATRYLGVRYCWGSDNPKKGLDCSGLVRVVFRKFGMRLPHSSRKQACCGAAIGKRSLRRGDLVFFGHPIHHVGIYLGNNRFIHSPRRGERVKITVLNRRRDFACACRIKLKASKAAVR